VETAETGKKPTFLLSSPLSLSSFFLKRKSAVSAVSAVSTSNTKAYPETAEVVSCLSRLHCCLQRGGAGGASGLSKRRPLFHR
jgi:hypothetical protein